MPLLPVTAMALGVWKSSVFTQCVTKYSLRLLAGTSTACVWSSPLMEVSISRSHTLTTPRCRCSCTLQDFLLHTSLYGQKRTCTQRKLCVMMNSLAHIYQGQIRFTRLLFCLNYQLSGIHNQKKEVVIPNQLPNYSATAE